MFIYFFCLCPLDLTIKLNLIYQKWPSHHQQSLSRYNTHKAFATATLVVLFIDAFNFVQSLNFTFWRLSCTLDTPTSSTKLSIQDGVREKRLVGVRGPLLKTLILFMIKIYDFQYPINFMTWP